MVLKENYSSLNRMVSDFIEWLTLNSKKGITVTTNSAKTKISRLFKQNTMSTTTKIQHVMGKLADTAAKNYLTDAQKQEYKKIIQKDKQNDRKKKN